VIDGAGTRSQALRARRFGRLSQSQTVAQPRPVKVRTETGLALAESVGIAGLGDLRGLSMSLHLEIPPDAIEPDRLAVELRIPWEVVRELAVGYAACVLTSRAIPLADGQESERRTMGHGSECEPRALRKPDAPLDTIAQELRARDLEVRESRHGDELIEIVIVNPQEPDKGEARVGYDGNVTWEYHAEIETPVGIEKIRGAIVNVLVSDTARSSTRVVNAEGSTDS
jgi:hypothetical protein